GARAGVVSAYYRKNLTDPWTVIGQQSFTSFNDVSVGLAVTSHADGTKASATFANVDLRNNPMFESTDIGTTGGSTTSDGVVTSITSKGADIWNTSDQFRYAHERWEFLDGSITARVRSVQNVYAWTK